MRLGTTFSYSNGSSYEGSVSVTVYNVDLEDEESMQPGPLETVDGDGATVALISYGMFNIILRDQEGNMVGLYLI